MRRSAEFCLVVAAFAIWVSTACSLEAPAERPTSCPPGEEDRRWCARGGDASDAGAIVAPSDGERSIVRDGAAAEASARADGAGAATDGAADAAGSVDAARSIDAAGSVDGSLVPPEAPVFPSFDGSKAPKITVGPGQKKTFSYGGKTIEVAYLAPGRTAYAKRNSITPGGVIRLNNGKLYDGHTLAPMGSLTAQDGRASYREEAFFTLDSAGNLSKHTLGGKVTKVGSVAGAIGSGCRFGQGEGTQSHDDNEWIINDGGDDNAGEVAQSYAYLNVKTGKVVTRSESQILSDSNKLYQNGAHHVDYVSMSLLGKIVAYVKGNAARWVLYDAEFSNPRKIGDPHIRAAHATFFIGEEGEDMMLNAHWDAFVIVDLDEPSTVYALTWGGHGHFSPNFARRGFVASFDGGETRTGTFSKSWFPTSGSKSSKDKSYLGLHYRASGPHEMVANLACNQVKNEYINTALAVASHDGKMIFATVQDGTNIYTVRIRAL